MVRLAPVVLEVGEPLEQQVERITLAPALLVTPALASTEPPAVETVVAQKQVRKVKRSRRKRDEAPLPPWLAKRGRR